MADSSDQDNDAAREDSSHPHQEPRSPQPPRENSAPRRTRTTLILASAAGAVVLVLVTVALTLFAVSDDDSSVNDGTLAEETADEPSSSPETWTLEDLVSATCVSGAYNESTLDIFSGALFEGHCYESQVGDSQIFYVVQPSEFEADNMINGSASAMINAYALEPLDSGEYLIIFAHTTNFDQGFETLSPLQDDYGIPISSRE